MGQEAGRKPGDEHGNGQGKEKESAESGPERAERLRLKCTSNSRLSMRQATFDSVAGSGSKGNATGIDYGEWVKAYPGCPCVAQDIIPQLLVTLYSYRSCSRALMRTEASNV